jgi:hypothetical protein
LLSSATQISPPWGPKPIGTTAGPSISPSVRGPDANTFAMNVAFPFPSTLKTPPSWHVTIMSKPNVPKWSNVIPLWSGEVHPRGARSANGVTIPSWILKTLGPSVTKTSRGVNGVNPPPEFTDCAEAIVMYFSRQEPNPGNVANNEAVPLQSTLSMFSLQNSVTSKRSGAAATPVGKGT